MYLPQRANKEADIYQAAPKVQDLYSRDSLFSCGHSFQKGSIFFLILPQLYDKTMVKRESLETSLVLLTCSLSLGLGWGWG